MQLPCPVEIRHRIVVWKNLLTALGCLADAQQLIQPISLFVTTTSRIDRCVKMDPSTGSVAASKAGGESKSFTYDAVYDERSEQRDIYDETVRPIVNDVLMGYDVALTHDGPAASPS